MKLNITEQNLKSWGVYIITNLITKEIYVGSTTESFAKRYSKHISNYYEWKNRFGLKSTPKLYDAFEKYNIDNFELTIYKYFINKKDSVTNKKIATFLEEKLINKLNPEYNVCKKPTLSGCPNLGKKLSQEWKNNISKKSKLYKHKNNLEVYNKKIKQNKELSSLYELTNLKTKEQKILSFVDCQLFLKCSASNVWTHFKTNKTINDWSIVLLKSQKKKISLFINNSWKSFKSFNECDRFLNMWRGFTSTQTVNNKNKILNYNFKLD